MYRFTEDCLTGIETIDEEHRRLFQLINESIELLKENGASKVIVKNLLKELREYAGTHFAHEEAYMEQIKDLELPRQRKEHAQFAAKVDSYKIADLTEEESSQAAQELLSFMAKWLYRHILGSDTMIGKMTSESKKEDAFAFTDQYRTGITLIDDEHRRLFEIIKETNDVIEEELVHDKFDAIVHILEELKDYTKYHFGHEEEYMKSINYGKRFSQMHQHTQFIEKLESYDLKNIDENQQAGLLEIIDFLAVWLQGHIKGMDKRIPKVEA